MARRGPDDEGHWTDGQNCALGFRRLSILDLSPAGHQPMFTPDGRYVLVFNGEVYNFRALRAELEERGVRFRSTGDAEVVLHALAEWGLAALDRFNGMFALAFYDAREKRLLLARDHAGIKPLYYMRTAQGVVFGSQYDQLLAHPWRGGLSVDPAALALYLRFGYIPAPYALLRGTFMLEPGCWIELEASGKERSGRWFTFPNDTRPDLSGEAAFEAVDAAVTAAVKHQLISDVPVGTFLSGGIDSPLVTAKARQVSDIQAFTIGSEDLRLDETTQAEQYARDFGVRHIVETVTSEQACAMLEEVTAACSEPFGDYSIIPTMLVSRLARRDVTVMLSGDGGDELFWGYSGRFASVLRKSADFRYPHWFRTLRWVLESRVGIGHENHNPHYFANIGEWYCAKHSRNPNGLLARAFPDMTGFPADFDLFTYAGTDPDRTAQWLRWNEFTGHLSMVLLKVDRASMYHSLEVRVPFLDREVIDTALRCDWKSCLDIRNSLGKIPLRRSLGRYTQHQSLEKRGFSVPMDAWLRGPMRSVVEAVLFSRREVLGFPFHAEPVRDLYFNSNADTWGLWVLLSLALWEDRYLRAG